ncbi:MAG: hypothetical protein GX086_10270 [Alcaligenaceae bacterium]|nr:hypothetical protein [Alcaligenaceae bacterium]
MALIIRVNNQCAVTLHERLTRFRVKTSRKTSITREHTLARLRFTSFALID